MFSRCGKWWLWTVAHRCLILCCAFFFSFYLFFYCRDGFACHCLYGRWRERQRNGNCTWRPGYGSIRSVSWRLCWQKKPSPSHPKTCPWELWQQQKGLIGCSLQTGFVVLVKNSFSHSSHSLCGYTFKQWSLRCLGSVYIAECSGEWGIWLLPWSVIFAGISRLGFWLFCASSTCPDTLRGFVQSQNPHSCVLSFPWQWGPPLGVSCMSLWGRALLSWCWQPWLCLMEVSTFWVSTTLKLPPCSAILQECNSTDFFPQLFSYLFCSPPEHRQKWVLRQNTAGMGVTLPFLIPSFCFAESEGNTFADTFEGPVYHYCSRYQTFSLFFPSLNKPLMAFLASWHALGWAALTALLFAGLHKEWRMCW